MATKLLSYLKGISGNAADLKQFWANPALAGHQAGLSQSEISALISKNPGAISGAIKAGGGLAASDDVNVTIVVVVAP
jgi:hypothetical protein